MTPSLTPSPRYETYYSQAFPKSTKLWDDGCNGCRFLHIPSDVMLTIYSPAWMGWDYQRRKE